MTDDEVRLAMARACGWTKDKLAAWQDWVLADKQMQYGQIDTEEFYRRHLRVDPTPEAPPDYPNDLNATHEAEHTLVFPEAYTARLIAILQRDFQSYRKRPDLFSTTGWHFACAHATARQRSEAFLRVIGEWTDEPPNESAKTP